MVYRLEESEVDKSHAGVLHNAAAVETQNSDVSRWLPAYMVAKQLFIV